MKKFQATALLSAFFQYRFLRVPQIPPLTPHHPDYRAPRFLNFHLGHIQVQYSVSFENRQTQLKALQGDRLRLPPLQSGTAFRRQICLTSSLRQTTTRTNDLMTSTDALLKYRKCQLLSVLCRTSAAVDCRRLRTMTSSAVKGPPSASELVESISPEPHFVTSSPRCFISSRLYVFVS